MYRLMSSEMLKGLNLEAKLAGIESRELRMCEKRAISKALWGHFIFEKYLLLTHLNSPSLDSVGTVLNTILHLPSMLAYTYLQASLTGPPGISRAWLEPEEDDHTMSSPEATGSSRKRLRGDTSPCPKLVRGALDAGSEVSKLLYETMKYNTSYHVELGSAEDLKVRRGLYAEFLDLRDTFPAKLQVKSNFTPQTCLLR